MVDATATGSGAYLLARSLQWRIGTGASCIIRSICDLKERYREANYHDRIVAKGLLDTRKVVFDLGWLLFGEFQLQIGCF